MLKKIITFFEQVKEEMRKVVWPTRKETMSSTIMIVIFSFIFALFFFFVDHFFMWLMSFVFNF